MKRDTDLRKAINGIKNVSEFCVKHRLPLRTVMRIKAGGRPNQMTMLAITQALELERL